MEDNDVAHRVFDVIQFETWAELASSYSSKFTLRAG
jgi:hypothetical protein